MEELLLDAKKKAMSILQQRDKTEWQLREYLAGKGFSEEAVEAALAYVKSFHYVDDLRFARHFVEVHKGQRSHMRLRQDLYQKHVPEEYIDLVLEEQEDGESVALQNALQKITKGQTEFSYEEKQKIAAKLFRKGFRMDGIKRALDM